MSHSYTVVASFPCSLSMAYESIGVGVFQYPRVIPHTHWVPAVIGDFVVSDLVVGVGAGNCFERTGAAR
jgi:hypothetical protein